MPGNGYYCKIFAYFSTSIFLFLFFLLPKALPPHPIPAQDQVSTHWAEAHNGVENRANHMLFVSLFYQNLNPWGKRCSIHILKKQEWRSSSVLLGSLGLGSVKGAEVWDQSQERSYALHLAATRKAASLQRVGYIVHIGRNISRFMRIPGCQHDMGTVVDGGLKGQVLGPTLSGALTRLCGVSQHSAQWQTPALRHSSREVVRVPHGKPKCSCVLFVGLLFGRPNRMGKS